MKPLIEFTDERISFCGGFLLLVCTGIAWTWHQMTHPWRS